MFIILLWFINVNHYQTYSFGFVNKMAAGAHMAATQQAADDQASSLYFSGICQTISVKCQHRNENGLLTCSRNLYVSCKLSNYLLLIIYDWFIP